MFGIRDKKLSPYMTENVHEELIRLENLVKIYDTGAIKVLGLKKISLTIRRGEFVAIMGHSGSGKSTLMNILGCLDRPTMGHYYLDGIDTAELDPNELSAVRNLKIGFVFQSFNLISRTSALKNVELPMTYARIPKRTRAERAMELLECVGLGARADHMPNEMSGGQRQRISIARTLALNPRFIICDEPISALDVSIQAQIINLLKEIQDELGISYLFVAHDLSMVNYISHRIGVMYLGHLVEEGPADQVYEHPIHPYTKALLSAIPIPDPDVAKSRSRIKLEGELPTPINPPAGCPFKGRCPMATEECGKSRPEMRDFGGHKAACFYAEAGK